MSGLEQSSDPACSSRQRVPSALPQLFPTDSGISFRFASAAAEMFFVVQFRVLVKRQNTTNTSLITGRAHGSKAAGGAAMFVDSPPPSHNLHNSNIGSQSVNDKP
jgi:hypothetical protein